MLKKYSRQFSGLGLMIAASLVVTPLVTAVEAADKTPKPRQRANDGGITASPSRAIWGQPVQLTTVLPPVYNDPGNRVTFYDNCLPAPREALGTVPVLNGGAQLRITADKLHLGSNDLQLSVTFPDGTSIDSSCQTNVISVLPVAR